ncbi:MAG: YkgJ family cysteine cluster protein [Candidatus Woesearchaeota archaeon]
MTNAEHDLTLTMEARKGISRFCYEECHALCCRKGFLPVKLKELQMIAKDKLVDSCLNGHVNKNSDGNYSLFMGKFDAPCPALLDHKCTIHSSKSRPQVCRDYPIFLDREKKEVKLSPKCPAVQENKFYGYEAKMQALGYKILKPHPYSEFEFNNVE